MKTCYTYFTAKLTKYFHIIVTYWLQFSYALSAEEFFNSRGEIYHARRAIRVSECAQSHLYRNSERAQSRRKNVKCFARKTPKKQGFKT